jgi:hypothetical protein
VTALRFVVPMPSNLANARMHWTRKHRERRAYFARLDELLAFGQFPRPPKAPFAKATIRAVMHLGAAMDEGNAMHRAEKWPCDWLKTRGYIVDDNRKCLTWEGLPEQIVKRGAEYFIELTLTPK